MHPAKLLRLGLAFGLLAGFLEVALFGFDYYVLGKFLTLSQHAVWMVPLVDAALFALVAMLLLPLHRLLPRVFSAATIIAVMAALLVFIVLLHFPRFHSVAATLLSLGIGVQAGRSLGRGTDVVDRMARPLVAGLGAIVLVVAAGMIASIRLGERNALARLGPARPGAPNVLLIILDTVREMNLSLYGYPRPTTPSIDAWAKSGVVFDHAFSTAPWTLPSHASMFTGREAFTLETNWETPLERGPATLAEVLARHGYGTAAFVANVRYTGRETGLARGFARYQDYRVDIGEAIKSARPTEAFHSTFNIKLHLPGIRPRTWAPEISGRFLRWLDRRSTDRPFFVFLNYLDAHAPYTPPAPFRARFETDPGAKLPNIEDSRPNKVKHPPVRFTEADAKPSMDLYDGAIAGLDAEIGRLLGELEKRGLLENTIVVLASDHGEGFAEHGLLGHANSLYRESLQVPLVISWPGHVPAGRRVSQPVSLRDLAATIVDLAGAGTTELPGASLARTWNSASTATPEPLVSNIRKLINQPAWWPASHGDMMSLFLGRYHYIVNRSDRREELFDTVSDPKEQHDLAAGDTGAVELPALRRALERIEAGTSSAVAVH
jgi:arylsulfatase A-like enzyme